MNLNIKHFVVVKTEDGGGHYETINCELNVNDYKKTDLLKKAKALIEDIFDNYDKSYTKEEKEKIVRLINDMNELNISLDYHDKTKKSFWDNFKNLFKWS